MRVTGATQLDLDQAERLLAVGRSLVSDLDPESILQQIVETARELTGARYAVIGVQGEEEGELERFLYVGVDIEARERIGMPPRGHGMLSVPITIRDEVYGNVYLTEKPGGEFTAADERAVVVLADWAGVAIDNARLYAREQRRREELEQAVSGLEATTSIAHALVGETDLDLVLALIAERGRRLVDARWAAILIRDGNELELRATHGDIPMRPIGQRYGLDDTLAGDVLRRGVSRTVTDLSRQAVEEDRELVRQLGAEHALLVPLEFRGRGVGVLMVATVAAAGEDGFSATDQKLLEGFAASAATAVATAQSVAADQLRQSVASAERERRRWARDLHDETLQELGAVQMVLDSALRRGRPDELGDVLASVQDTIAGSIDGLHRMINELRPAALDELGIKAAVGALVERRRGGELAIDLDVDLDWEGGRRSTRLAPEVESTVYRIVQESLTNVNKHAEARRATIEIAEHDGVVEIDVADDGVGMTAARTHGSGFGLIGMRERVALLGGRLAIESPPDGGTRIHAVLPAPHV